MSADNPLSNAISFAPFSHGVALLLTALSVALSEVCIYWLDAWLLKRAGLDSAQAKRSALYMAVITAPYLYLFPSGILYR